MLAEPLDKLAYIVVKAREFDVQVRPGGPDAGSNPLDDMGIGNLEATAGTPFGPSWPPSPQTSMALK